MIKVMTVIGTRPEAIKMAPVIKELSRQPQVFKSVVCASAQQREMLDQVLDLFQIVPDYDLDVMRPDQSLTELMARSLSALDSVISQEQPDWLLVQGDTSTVVAASLVAYFHRIKVGHVEAGLRTGDKYRPFPEEINRRIADVIADLYFAPTDVSRQNLLREGIAPDLIVVTGNTVIDALMMTAQRLESRPKRVASLDGVADKRLVLVTAHRRENFGAPLAGICQALAELARRHQNDIHIVYPVHLNPNVRGPVNELLAGVPNVSLLDPVDYETMVYLMKRAYLILTDSGGLQEEAPSLDRPLLILRDVTERPEVTEVGAAKLVGTESKSIVGEASRLLEDRAAYAAMACAPNPYGDGHARLRIARAIQAHHQGSDR